MAGHLFDRGRSQSVSHIRPKPAPLRGLTPCREIRHELLGFNEPLRVFSIVQPGFGCAIEMSLVRPTRPTHLAGGGPLAP